MAHEFDNQPQPIGDHANCSINNQNRKQTREWCPLCGMKVLGDRHCKRLCEGCGYVESCEDLFPPDHSRALRHSRPES